MRKNRKPQQVQILPTGLSVGKIRGINIRYSDFDDRPRLDRVAVVEIEMPVEEASNLFIGAPTLVSPVEFGEISPTASWALNDGPPPPPPEGNPGKPTP
jgi:hypothetical protein